MSAASNSQCPVCRTAEVVCGKWTLLLIRDLADGCSRFCELERSLEGISPRTLSLRLRALEEEGIVERHTYPEVPPRVEYALTEKGEALVPLIEDMRRYGARWLFEDVSAEAGAGPSHGLVTSCKAACRRRSAGTGAEAWAVRDFLLNEVADAPCHRGGDAAQRPGCQRRPDPLRRRRGERRRFALLQLRAADRLATCVNATSELRALPAFAPARDAVAAAGIAAAYLEARGEPVPATRASARPRCSRSSSPRSGTAAPNFSLDRERLRNALADARRRRPVAPTRPTY